MFVTPMRKEGCAVPACNCPCFISPSIPAGSSIAILFAASCQGCGHPVTTHNQPADALPHNVPNGSLPAAADLKYVGLNAALAPPQTITGIGTNLNKDSTMIEPSDQSNAPQQVSTTPDKLPTKRQSPPHALSVNLIINKATSPRERLVKGLYRRLCHLHYVHIRSTPASGKSTLLMLLYNYIHENNPNNFPIYRLSSWWKPEAELRGTDSRRARFLEAYASIPEDRLWKYWLNWQAGWDWDTMATGFWLLIDEGQTTYTDDGFWNDFIKPIDYTFPGYVILFSSFGSPGPNPQDMQLWFPTKTLVTPINVTEPQRISLQPRPWKGLLNSSLPNAGDSGLGLLLTRDEVQDVVNKWNQYHFGSTGELARFSVELIDVMFSFTQGHVGIIRLLLKVFATRRLVEAKIRDRSMLTAWDLQEALFVNPNFHRGLVSSDTGPAPQSRAFPPIVASENRPSLQDPEIAKVFWYLLSHKRIRCGDCPKHVHPEALQTCFAWGWVHADLQDHEKVYVLPSRCFEWYISCILSSNPNSLFLGLSCTNDRFELQSQYPTALSLLLQIVHHFRPSQVRPLLPSYTRSGRVGSQGTKIGPGAKHCLPEALYRDEWYRCALNLLPPGIVRVMPEFYPLKVTGEEDYNRGWVDFHIPFQQINHRGAGGLSHEDLDGSSSWWRDGYTYEFVREDSAIDEHVKRFLPGGRYHSWLATNPSSAWLVVDFRMSLPKRWKPEYVGKLIYVVFQEIAFDPQRDTGPIASPNQSPIKVEVRDASGLTLREWVLSETS